MWCECSQPGAGGRLDCMFEICPALPSREHKISPKLKIVENELSSSLLLIHISQIVMGLHFSGCSDLGANNPQNMERSDFDKNTRKYPHRTRLSLKIVQSLLGILKRVIFFWCHASFIYNLCYTYDISLSNICTFHTFYGKS